jgi:hypothetical protein
MSQAPIKLLVCGGRDFNDRALLDRTLDELHQRTPVSLLIHGGARGADAMAGDWAIAKGIETAVYRPDWRRFGPRAGPLRNHCMLDEGKPDLVVAFPGGRGTADMIQRARDSGVPALIVG